MLIIKELLVFIWVGEKQALKDLVGNLVLCQVQFQLFSFDNRVTVYPAQFLLFSL